MERVMELISTGCSTRSMRGVERSVMAWEEVHFDDSSVRPWGGCSRI